MRCSNAPPGIAVEILVEVNVIPKLEIALQFRIQRVYLPLACRVLQEDAGEPVTKFLGDLIDCEISARARWTFDFEAIPIIVVELLERLDNQKVDWKPNGSAPIRVTPEG